MICPVIFWGKVREREGVGDRATSPVQSFHICSTPISVTFQVGYGIKIVLVALVDGFFLKEKKGCASLLLLLELSTDF